MKTTTKLVMGLTIFIIGGIMAFGGTLYSNEVYPDSKNMFDTSDSLVYFKLGSVALLFIGTLMLYRFEKDVIEKMEAKMITHSRENRNK